MFPITHIWFCKKVLGYVNPMTVLGAVFPDIVISGCLTHEETHRDGWGLYEVIERDYRDCMDFAKSMVTHMVNPSGLDYYGDECYGEGYKGYCFQKGQQIVDDVIAACRIPEDFGLWKAHNFVEMGIELNIADENTGLTEMLYEGFRDLETIAQISRPIESYFTLRGGQPLEAYCKRFMEYIELERLNSRTLAAKYDIQMRAKHGISIDIQRSADIIDGCRELVKSDFGVFIDYSLDKICNMLERKDDR